MKSVTESVTPLRSASSAEIEACRRLAVAVVRAVTSTPRDSSSCRRSASSSSSSSSSRALASSAVSSITPSLSASSRKLVMSFVSKLVSIWSSCSSGSGRAESPALEALDPTPLHERALDAGVRGMTVRAHLEYERFPYGARREFVPACATAHVGRLQFGVLPLHLVLLLARNPVRGMAVDGRMTHPTRPVLSAPSRTSQAPLHSARRQPVDVRNTRPLGSCETRKEPSCPSKVRTRSSQSSGGERSSTGSPTG